VLGVKVRNDIPETLADGHVVAALAVDDSMKFTGALKLFAGEERIGRVPKLAIVKKTRSKDLMVLHCDEDWNVLGIQVWNAPGGNRVRTIDEAKRMVEKYYTCSISKWVTTRTEE
jgi:hypothetical protein